MSKAPTSSGIGSGSAQIFDTSKSEGVYHAMQDRARQKKEEEQEKAELAAKEARGEFADLDMSKGWSMRDSDYLFDEWNKINNKYAGRFGEMYKNPRLQAEYNKDIALFKKIVNDSQAMKEVFGKLEDQFKSPEWTKYRTPEQQKQFFDILNQPGKKWSPEEITEMTKPKINLPNPLTRASELVPWKDFINQESKQWTGETGASGSKYQETLKRDEWKNSVSNMLDADDVFRAAAEEKYGDMDDPANRAKFLENAVNQYQAESEKTTYKAAPLSDSGGDEENVDVEIFEEGKEQTLETSEPHENRYRALAGETQFKDNKVYGVATTGGYKKTTNLGMGWNYANITGKESEDTPTGEVDVSIGNIKQMRVNSNGELDENGEKKWVIFGKTGQEHGAGQKTVYQPLDAYVLQHKDEKRKYDRFLSNTGTSSNNNSDFDPNNY